MALLIKALLYLLVYLCTGPLTVIQAMPSVFNPYLPLYSEIFLAERCLLRVPRSVSFKSIPDCGRVTMFRTVWPYPAVSRFIARELITTYSPPYGGAGAKCPNEKRSQSTFISPFELSIFRPFALGFCSLYVRQQSEAARNFALVHDSRRLIRKLKLPPSKVFTFTTSFSPNSPQAH